jgi:hypothetical protein
MNAKTENHQLECELTLRDSFQSPLTIHAVTLALTKQDDQLIECRLTFQVKPELYQRIDAEALFNLKPEVRNPSGGDKRPQSQK